MKNIHLIPTDKPTGIFQSNTGLQFSIRDKVRTGPFVGYHIYITSDEEIKEGDYAIQFHYSKISIVNCDSQNKSVINNKSLDLYATKIILTTDQDLIADGVQSIDDEFLKWFVENPNCECVKIKREIKAFDGENKEIDFAIFKEDYTQDFYKIIIPQESLTYSEASKKEERIFNTKMIKRETLREAADNWVEKPVIGTRRESFIAGAKWQAERMYSEEDMSKAFFQGWVTRERFNDLSPDIIYPKGLDYEEKQDYAFNLWFERVKKN
jgi:hypothetical protein